MNSSLINKTQNTIESHNLCDKSHDHIIVGVSGGIDSMVLVSILHTLGYSIAIAHCNFSLRGAESDEDELFVRSFAERHRIPLFVKQFDTPTYAHEHGISIEMAARNLRYNWFQELCDSESFTKIAIAHNANDSIETLFIHLFRTTGLKGLCGIPIINQRIIRPLLECTRQEIEAYAHEHSIAYRHDSSNSENIYIRNKIRNQLLPLCTEIQPNSIKSIGASMRIIQDSYKIYKKTIEKEIQKITSTLNNTLVIEKEDLLNHEHAHTLLFEIMHPYGFHVDVIEQLFDALSKQSGKQFESEQYTAIIDRDYVFIEKQKLREPIHIEIPDLSSSFSCTTPLGTLFFEIVDDFDVPTVYDPNVVYFDKDMMHFPLHIRTWHVGDSFVPFGMNGRKKVSDLLIDKKIPIHQKPSVLVVESGTTILWVVGQRRAQAAPITNNTHKTLIIRYSHE